ncbi:hypothetical protein G4B88_001007, partial [Cannabis sativa]
SACNGFEEEGVMIAAASEAIWDDKGACGRMYKVRCIGGTNQGVSNPCRGRGSIVVKIVDLCPAPGCRGTIDLSQEAFAMIADPNEGKINIKFTQSKFGPSRPGWRWDLASACNGFEEEGVMIAAASEAIWDDKGACGRMYKVRCIGGTNQGVSNPCRGGGSIVVKIVDLCPSPGCRGTIDLSQEAFAMIADPNEGKINIKFTQ